MTKNIYVAGHKGMVGSAIVKELSKSASNNLVLADKKDLNLVNQKSVEIFFRDNKIDEVYLAAARVGGIFANNTYPANFIYENLMIQANVINSSFHSGVEKLLFLGSSCIYPKYANQPIKENFLLGGHLEETNEAYAIAKIAGIKLCENYNKQYGVDYRSVMPTNLYGPGDNYHLQNSHVIPALIKKFHDAKILGSKKVVVWGSGTPKREFLHVDDMAAACTHIMKITKEIYQKEINPNCSHINIGSGIDCSINDLAHLIKEIVGFEGKIIFDKSKPDGTPRKLMDITKLKSFGWMPNYSLQDGLRATYNDFVQNIEKVRSK